MKAWLVTWVWIGDHARKENTLVSVLSIRLSEANVAKHVERLYTDRHSSLSDRLRAARGDPPYRSVIERGRISCGHNPYLYARRVSNVRIVSDGAGGQRLDFDEPPPPAPRR